ncbi:hypothetical protein [Archaeoglobus neptunius]|uniref:hypothetical protein n=1 Tax=Archaeoglobus neptunius TaxID=2798580 RepID=UPI0019251758|nr:hypothetical protein [Archaeoglobus neptunius]
MGKLLLSNNADEVLINFLRDRDKIFRKLGVRILEDGRPAKTDEIYVGSKIELESPNFRNAPDVSRVVMELTPDMRSEFFYLLPKLRPFVSYEYTPLGSHLWLHAEEKIERVRLTCPFCGAEGEYALSQSGVIYPDICECGVNVSVDVSDGLNFSVTGIADFGVRGKRVKAGVVEYSAAKLEGVPKSFEERLIDVLHTPEAGTDGPLTLPAKGDSPLHTGALTGKTPENCHLNYPDDSLYDGAVYFTKREKPLHRELCVVFYRKNFDKERLLIAESASPLIVSKIKAVFHRLKDSQLSVLVDGKEVEDPSNLVPGVAIEIASELFIPQGEKMVLPVQLGDLPPDSPFFLLDPLLDISITDDGFITLEPAELHEATLKCPFCGEEETYLLSSQSDETYPSTCDCGAMVSAVDFVPLPEINEESLEKFLNRVVEKTEYGEALSPVEESILSQLDKGYIVEKRTVEGVEWIKVKKLTERARGVPYPCLNSIVVPTTVWLTDLGHCWIAFEKDDVEYVTPP